MKSSRKPTPRSAIRIECYIPERLDQDAYNIAFDWLCDEFAHAHGGCSAIEGVDGRYRSTTRFIVPDRITLVWCDLPWSWTVARERAEAVAYAVGLRDYLSALLPQEEVMYIVLVPVFTLE
ncbi:MAG: hypothetical protein AABN34_14435 [Acidobacteriota bacterium]